MVLQVEMAISRKKKEDTVDKARQQLENCYLIASINYKKLTVSTDSAHCETISSTAQC